jgi:hypothetical protein
LTLDQRPALSNYQHRRRDLLGGIAGAAVAGTPVAAPALAGAAVDPHVEWERQLPALRAASEALANYEDDAGEAAYDAACDAIWNTEERIMLTPAETIEGVMAQLRRVEHVLAELRTVSRDNQEATAIGHALATLQRLAGRAAV